MLPFTDTSAPGLQFGYGAQSGPATGTPLIIGKQEVSYTLTANRGTVQDPDGIDEGTIAYIWERDDIQQSVGDTYLLTEADEGAIITMWMTFDDLLGNPEARESLPTDPIAPYAEPVGIPNMKQLSNNQSGTIFNAPSYIYSNYLVTEAEINTTGWWEDKAATFAAKDIVFCQLQGGIFRTLRFISPITTITVS